MGIKCVKCYTAMDGTEFRDKEEVLKYEESKRIEEDIYITSDGKEFIDRDVAWKHEQELYKRYVYTFEFEFTPVPMPYYKCVRYTEKIIDNEITYRVIIDNPKEDIKNIEAIIIHDKYTEDIFPSTGIFDDKLNLIPETIDKDKNYVKGIILTGYIPFKGDINDLNATFKVLVKYTDKFNVESVVMYSTKK